MQSTMSERIYYVSPSVIIKMEKGRGPFLISRNGTPSIDEVRKAVTLCNMRIVKREGGDDTYKYLLEEMEESEWQGKVSYKSEGRERASS